MIDIAIPAPATPITRETADAVLRIAEEMGGLNLHFHPQCFEECGHFAGSEDTRLSALIECANDPEMDAVWMARGGYGSNAIAAEAVANMNGAARAKQFLGYSDGGYLLAALYRARIGLPVHAPMPVDIIRDGGEVAVRRALAFLKGERGGLEPNLDERPVAAFNLMTLAMLCGTDLMPDLSGHVVMVEEVGEYLYAIDRLFFHVTQQLGDIAGLRLRRTSEVPENDRPFGTDAQQIARTWCERAGIAYLGRADIGHDIENRIVPFGTRG